MSIEDLKILAEYASKKGRHLTIRSSNKKLEDLKKIAAEGKGFLTIEITGV